MGEMVCEVKNLRVSAGDHELVRGVSFSLEEGKTLGLVGESGSGKTLTLKSVMDLLPAGLNWQAELRRVTENTAMIFQNPLGALDPLCPVFRQLLEVIGLRQGVGAEEARERGTELLRRLALPEELARRDRFPGELSGGQCQRILIAMALACRPKLLLCDEPTTALDVTVQKQTMELIQSLQREENFAMLFVTHNLAVASQMCERLAVMREGEIIESGSREELLEHPRREYTRRLIGAILDVPEREA